MAQLYNISQMTFNGVKITGINKVAGSTDVDNYKLATTEYIKQMTQDIQINSTTYFQQQWTLKNENVVDGVKVEVSTIYPTLDITTEYSDNVYKITDYKTTVNTTDSLIIKVASTYALDVLYIPAKIVYNDDVYTKFILECENYNNLRLIYAPTVEFFNQKNGTTIDLPYINNNDYNTNFDNMKSLEIVCKKFVVLNQITFSSKRHFKIVNTEFIDLNGVDGTLGGSILELEHVSNDLIISTLPKFIYQLILCSEITRLYNTKITDVDYKLLKFNSTMSTIFIPNSMMLMLTIINQYIEDKVTTITLNAFTKSSNHNTLELLDRRFDYAMKYNYRNTDNQLYDLLIKDFWKNNDDTYRLKLNYDSTNLVFNYPKDTLIDGLQEVYISNRLFVEQQPLTDELPVECKFMITNTTLTTSSTIILSNGYNDYIKIDTDEYNGPIYISNLNNVFVNKYKSDVVYVKDSSMNVLTDIPTTGPFVFKGILYLYSNESLFSITFNLCNTVDEIDIEKQQKICVSEDINELKFNCKTDETVELYYPNCRLNSNYFTVDSGSKLSLICGNNNDFVKMCCNTSFDIPNIQDLILGESMFNNELYTHPINSKYNNWLSVNSPTNLYLPSTLIANDTTKNDLSTFFGNSNVNFYIYCSEKKWKNAIKLL